MGFIFSRKRELRSTFDHELYLKISGILDDEGIWYAIERTHTGSGRAGPGMKSGILHHMTTQYQIFVKKADYEEARLRTGL